MAFSITNEAGSVPTLWIYGDIGGWFGGITDTDVRDGLESLPKGSTLDVRINSNGGDYFVGTAIRSLLLARQEKVRVFIDGLAASAASLIAAAGDEVEMAVGSQIMIHQVSGGAFGTWQDLLNASNEVKKTNEGLPDFYADRWNGTRQQLIDAINAETWYSADAAVEVGLADRVAKSKRANFDSAGIDKFNYKHTPDIVLKTVQHNELAAKLVASFPEHKELYIG